MVHKISIPYPHSITVIAKSTVQGKTDEDLKRGGANAFQIWLNKNYIENDNITCGISMLWKDREAWQKSAKTIGINKTYEQTLDLLELFEGKTIEVIVGM